MPQTDTFLMRGVTPPTGVLIPDFCYVTQGRLQPVILRTRDEIDLESVEVEKFVASVVTGTLAQMLASGSLVRVAVEVSEGRAAALKAAYAATPKPVKEGPYEHNSRTMMLEPGVQVQVAGLPTPQRKAAPAPVVTEPPVGDNVEGSAGAQPQSEFEGVATQVGAQTEPEVVDWKSGKTLPEQEQIIKTSTDVAFLEKVAANPEEAKKIQRLARARLSEL